MSRASIPLAVSRAITASTASLLADRATAAVSPWVVTPIISVARSGGAWTVPVPVTVIVETVVSCPGGGRQRQGQGGGQGQGLDEAHGTSPWTGATIQGLRRSAASRSLAVFLSFGEKLL